MYITVTLYWVYLIILWLFRLVCILCCGCFNLFCDVWVLVCGGGVLLCVGVLIIVWVFWYYMYVYLLCFVFLYRVYIWLRLCIYNLIRNGVGMSKHNCLCICFIMLTTTCSGHCGPSWGHKNLYRGKLYCVWSLVMVHILNFQRDLVVWFIHI